MRIKSTQHWQQVKSMHVEKKHQVILQPQNAFRKVSHHVLHLQPLQLTCYSQKTNASNKING